MFKKAFLILLFGILYLSISGCLYRGDGVFKKIGDTDYKANINFMNLIVAADGRPTYVCGYVLLEDHLTPLKNTHIILKKKDQNSIVASTYSDHTGIFNLTGILSNASYTIEIDSPDYSGKKDIIVEPDKNNAHELIAQKNNKL